MKLLRAQVDIQNNRPDDNIHIHHDIPNSSIPLAFIKVPGKHPEVLRLPCEPVEGTSSGFLKRNSSMHDSNTSSFFFGSIASKNDLEQDWRNSANSNSNEYSGKRNYNSSNYISSNNNSIVDGSNFNSDFDGNYKNHSSNIFQKYISEAQKINFPIDVPVNAVLMQLQARHDSENDAKNNGNNSINSSYSSSSHERTNETFSQQETMSAAIASTATDDVAFDSLIDVATNPSDAHNTSANATQDHFSFTSAVSPTKKKLNSVSSHDGSFMGWPGSEDGTDAISTKKRDDKCKSDAIPSTHNQRRKKHHRTKRTQLDCTKISSLSGYPTPSSIVSVKPYPLKSSMKKHTSEKMCNTAQSTICQETIPEDDNHHHSGADGLRPGSSHHQSNKTDSRKMRNNSGDGGRHHSSLSSTSHQSHRRKPPKLSQQQLVHLQQGQSQQETMPSMKMPQNASAVAVPLLSWDAGEESDASSFRSRLSHKSSLSNKSLGLKSTYSTLSRDRHQNGGDFFYDEFIPRGSFKRMNDSSGCLNLERGVSEMEEEFNRKAPWKKGPVNAVRSKKLERRSSGLTSRSSIDSLLSGVDILPIGNESDEVLTGKTPAAIEWTSDPSLNLISQPRLSFTSSLGDEQSIGSDITELRQAQEALFPLLENLEEEDKSQPEMLPLFGTDVCENHLEARSEKRSGTMSQIKTFSRTTKPSLMSQLSSVQEVADDDLSKSSRKGMKKSWSSGFSSERNIIDTSCLYVPSTGESIEKQTSDTDYESDTYEDEKESDSGSDYDDEHEVDDVEGGTTTVPSIRLCMSITDVDLEKTFNTKHLEDIDFNETEENYEDSLDELEIFLDEAGNANINDDVRSGKSSNRTSKTNGTNILSSKLKPIKNRLKKQTGSNHVRRRHKRLWKLLVWNCRKITICVVLFVCILTVTIFSSFRSTSKLREKNEMVEGLTDDQIATEDDLQNYTQRPQVGETGQNPIELVESLSNSPSFFPSQKETKNIDNENSSDVLTNITKPTSVPTILHAPSMVFSNHSVPILYPSSDSQPSLNTLNNHSSVISKNSSHLPTKRPSTTSQSNITHPFPTISPSALKLNFSFIPSTFNYHSSQPFVSFNLSSSYNETDYKSHQIIAGEKDFEYAGFSVAMTPSGNFIAIGFKEADGKVDASGLVRVYKKEGVKFLPLGTDSMFGTSPMDEFGAAVSISGNGHRVAVGSRSSSTFEKEKNGEVKVYDYLERNNTWRQVGNSIFGLDDLDRLGFSVAISDDGLRVACGSPRGNGGSGSVSVYEYNGAEWVLMGDPVVGDKAGDRAGFSVALSNDGSTLAVGSFSASKNGLTHCGSVSVYTLEGGFKYAPFTRRGQVLMGKSNNAQFGYSIALSGHGDRIVIGSNGYSSSTGSNVGSCEVYELKNSKWTLVGSLVGEAENEKTGYFVSMAKNGNWFACSKARHDGGSSNGVVTILKENKTKWNVMDSISSTLAESSSFGSSTSLSQDGRDIVIGAPLFKTSVGYAELFSQID